MAAYNQAKQLIKKRMESMPVGKMRRGTKCIAKQSSSDEESNEVGALFRRTTKAKKSNNPSIG